MSLARPLIGLSLFAARAHPQGRRLEEADASGGGTDDPAGSLPAIPQEPGGPAR